MVTTNPPTPKGSKARVLRNALLQKGDRITISPNDKYPSAQAEVLRFDVDIVEVRVIGGDFDGSVWLIPRSEFTVDAPAVDVEEGVSNTPPDSHEGVKSTSSSSPQTSKLVSEKEVRVYEPGLTPKRLRQQLAAGNVNLAEGGKGFKKPRLRKNRKKAIECLQAHLDDTTQQIDEGLRVHPDWIQGVGVASDLEDFEKLLVFLANVLGEEVFYEPHSPRKMGRVWESSGRCANGFAFLCNQRSDEEGGGYDVWMSFPGALLSSRSVRHWWKACKGLRQLVGFRATRFDIALDDYDKSVDLNLIREAILAGNVRGLKLDSKKSYRFIDSPKGGWTTQLGAPKSAAGLCVYDKEAESEGKLPCHRWEQRLKADYAAQALDDWLKFGSKGFEEVSSRYLGGLVVGRYEFIDRVSKPDEKNLSRIPELPWWKVFVDRVGCQIKHARKRPVFSIGRSMRWVIRQVVTTLVILKKVMGSEEFYAWLNTQMAKAEEFRLSRWHRHLIATFGNEVDSFVAVG